MKRREDMKNTKVAKAIKKLAEASAKKAVNKKLIIMLYEPEMPEAVKKAADRK